MNRHRWMAPLVAGVLAGPVPAQPDPSCGTVEACLRALVSAAESGPGISPRETDVAGETAKWGAEAVPGLVTLLEDRREGVRELAGYTLRSIGQVDAKYLPALMASQRRESGWLPIVIGRIGTDEAMNFLVDELRRDTQTESQIGFAFSHAGAKAIPYLLSLFRCERPCDPDLLRSAGRLLGRLEPAPVRAEAVMPLLDVARDARLDFEARRYAIVAIGDIGPQAVSAVPSLMEFMRQAPEFKDATERAIIATRSAEAVPILLRWLSAARIGAPRSERGLNVLSAIPWDQQPEMILDTLGRFGPQARDAAVHVLPYLQSTVLDERVAAADTLGRIGHVEAREVLLKALRDPMDWQLSYRAAEALGRLGEPAALPEVERAATDHWYPLVRAAAAQAVQRIRSGGTGETEEDEARSRRAFVWPDVASCERGPGVWKGPDGSAGEWSWSSHKPRLLRRLRYPAKSIEIGPATDMKPNRSGVIHISPDNMEVTQTTFQETPRVAFRVDDGWLLGGDRGEFGGELVFRNRRCGTEMLLEENVEDIFRLGDSIVVTTGLGHVGTRGVLYRVERGADGHWTARLWRRLPGAPRRSWLVDAQRLYVDTMGGGSIVIHADGRMEMAICGLRTPR